MIPSQPLNCESRTSTYFKSAALLLPAALASVFAALFLTPKLESVWQRAGASLPTGAEWVILASRFLLQDWVYLCAGAAVLFLLLEMRSTRWPRYRRGTIFATTILLNTAVFVGLTSMAVWAILAASLSQGR